MLPFLFTAAFLGCKSKHESPAAWSIRRSCPRSERDKVRRICTPKSTTGRLEVPKDILQMWNTDEGREKLLSMWCKSGAVKAGLKV